MQVQSLGWEDPLEESMATHPFLQRMGEEVSDRAGCVPQRTLMVDVQTATGRSRSEPA